jgi:hypothetical protein
MIPVLSTVVCCDEKYIGGREQNDLLSAHLATDILAKCLQ